MMRHRRKHTDPNAGGEMHSTSGEDENSRQEDDYTEGKISDSLSMCIINYMQIWILCDLTCKWNEYSCA